MEMDAGRSEMSTEEFQRDEDYTGDESNAARRHAMAAAEMASQVSNSFDVVVQRELLRLVVDSVVLSATIAVEDAVLVDRAQRQHGMEDGRLAETSLQEKRRPEVRVKGALHLDSSPDLKPLKMLLFCRARDGERDQGWIRQGWTRCRRPVGWYVTGLAVPVRRQVPGTATPDAVAVTLAACGETSTADWKGFVAFHLADPSK